jgi:hypothetical protein
MTHSPTLLCFRCRCCGQCLACERHAEGCKFSSAVQTCEATSPGTTALGALIGVRR